MKGWKVIFWVFRIGPAFLLILTLCGFSSCSDEIDAANFAGSYRATFDGIPGTINIQQITDSARVSLAFSATTFEIVGFIEGTHFQSEITGSAEGVLDLKLDFSEDGSSLNGTFAVGERIFRVEAVRTSFEVHAEEHAEEAGNHHH